MVDRVLIFVVDGVLIFVVDGVLTCVGDGVLTYVVIGIVTCVVVGVLFIDKNSNRQCFVVLCISAFLLKHSFFSYSFCSRYSAFDL